MSDFEPLFPDAADSAEFTPLALGGSEHFEPADFVRISDLGRDLPDRGAVEGDGVSRDGPGPDSDGELRDGTAGDDAEFAGDDPAREPSSGEGSLDAAVDGGEGTAADGTEITDEPAIDPALAAAEEAARVAGYQQGVEEGRAAMASRLEQVEDIVRQVEGLRSEFFARAVQDAGKAVVQIAEQVLRRELVVSSGDIEELVRGILQDVQSDDDFVIRIAGDDAETLRDAYPSLLELVGRDAGLRIEVDDRLLPGGAVVETSYGSIDASISTQLAAFTQSVEAWVKQEVEAHDD